MNACSANCRLTYFLQLMIKCYLISLSRFFHACKIIRSKSFKLNFFQIVASFAIFCTTTCDIHNCLEINGSNIHCFTSHVKLLLIFLSFLFEHFGQKLRHSLFNLCQKVSFAEKSIVMLSNKK